MLNNAKTSKILLAILLTLIIFSALLYPRTQTLNGYTFIDETFYLKHAAQFYWAVSNHEFEATFLVIHPGVPTLWLGSAAFWTVTPDFSERDTIITPDGHFREFLNEHNQTYESMQVYTRTMVILFNSLCLAGIFLLGWRLIGRWQAAGAVLLAGFSPYFFDFSRFLHIDGPLSILMLAALLAFLVYLKEGKWGWLALSALAIGLSTLTKVIGLIVLGVIGILALLEWARPSYERFGKKLRWEGFKKLFGAMLLLVFLTALTAFIVWPALWVTPGEAIGRIFGFILDRTSGADLSPMFFNGDIIPDGAIGWKYFYYYPLVYLWHSTPVSLFGLAALLLLFIFRPKPVFEEIPWNTIGKIMLYALVYTLLMTSSKQKFDRYILPASLALEIPAALGWWYAAVWAGGKLKRLQSWFPIAMLGAAVLVQGLLLLQVFPYGISYFNPLMGGPQKAPQVLQIGSGEGLDLAAEYLTTVPNKKDLVIRSPYSSTLDYHFYRQVEGVPLYEAQGFDKTFEADYVVLYLNQVQRGMSGPIVEFLADKPAEYTVVINGIEYAWIYRMSDFVDQ